jgi:hypothetical protein
MQAREAPTVSLASVVNDALVTLRKEATRRAKQSGLRDAETDTAAEVLSRAAELHRAWLLPAAGKVAETLHDVVTGPESDAADLPVWTAAAVCSAWWPGSFGEFAEGVLAKSTRALQNEYPAEARRLPWLANDACMACWSRVLLSTPAVSQTPSFRSYAELLPRGAPATPEGHVAFLAHVEAVALLLDPISPTLVQYASRLAAAAVRGGDAEAKICGMRLRAVLGALLHPRCAPLHVPLAAPAATRYEVSEAPLPSHHFNGGAYAPLQLPQASAAPPRRVVAPQAVPNPAASTAEPARKSHRTEQSLVTSTSAPTKPAIATDDFEVPSIVDEDIE